MRPSESPNYMRRSGFTRLYCVGMNTLAPPPMLGSSLEVEPPEIVSVLPTPLRSVAVVASGSSHEPRRFVVSAAGVPESGTISNSSRICALLRMRGQYRKYL